VKTTTVYLRLNDVKKHSVRYDKINENNVLTAMYVLKTAFGSGVFPSEIRVTVEWDDE
jgi:hypothetical protein